jgi:hypothetical protein
MARKKDDWFLAEQGVVVRRCVSDDLAAWEIANALDHGWLVMSHNVVWSPAFAIWFIIIAFAGKTEHVITFAKAAPAT